MFNLRRLLSVGSYRRGKSYFANTYGHHNGFELGSKVDESTNGIYIWDAPFLHDDKRKFLFRVLIAFSKDYNLLTYNKFVGVIVLDCEGIDDPKPWATKPFILCLAIFSTFIFNINNINGIIGRDDIGMLCLMTDIAFHIQTPNNSKFSPNLIILPQGFQSDNPINFDDYFLENLSKANNYSKKSLQFMAKTSLIGMYVTFFFSLLFIISRKRDQEVFWRFQGSRNSSKYFIL